MWGVVEKIISILFCMWGVTEEIISILQCILTGGATQAKVITASKTA